MRAVIPIVLLYLLGSAASGAIKPNILVLLADDLGASDVGCYGCGPSPARTPVIDGLAARGRLFRQAWSSPVCSPTRAGIQTGRQPHRTGVGFLSGNGGPALPLTEITLPKLLAAACDGQYTCAAFGKWHLGNAAVGGALAPNLAGYQHFSGNLTSLIDGKEDYYGWTKVVNGTIQPCSTYNTSDIVDDAVAWISKAPQPWLCHVGFNAPHVPLHVPPPGLHTVDLSQALPPACEPRPYFLAMVEAMDTEIGRLLEALGDAADNTWIVFAGDNGSPAEVALPGVPRWQSKISLFEPGIHVPLIVSGPHVPAAGSASDALVHTLDIFATVAELAGIDLDETLLPDHPIDSRSLLPYVADHRLSVGRSVLITEIFKANASGGFQFAGCAARDRQYKLLVGYSANPPLYGEALYDLESDPHETCELLGQPMALSPAAVQSYQKLWLALVSACQ